MLVRFLQIFHYKHIRSLQCDPEKCNHLHLEFKPFEHFWEIDHKLRR